MNTEKASPLLMNNVSYTLVKDHKNRSQCLLCCFDEHTCPDNGICIRGGGYWKLTYSITKEDNVITEIPISPLQELLNGVVY